MRAAAAVLAALLVGREPAAAPPFVEIDGVVHTRDAAFQVPVEIPAADEADAAAVRLWVSVDGGRTWERKREQSPRKPTIRFVAPRDGTYDLAMAVIGRHGQQRPPADRLTPGLRIVVDATPPALAAEMVQDETGRRGVAWTVSDACPAERLHVALAVQAAGRWRPLDAAPGAKVAWFPPELAVTAAQAHARDAAGNAATVQLDIRGADFRTRAVEAFALGDAPPAPGLLAQAEAIHRQPAPARAAAAAPRVDAAVAPTAAQRPAPDARDHRDARPASAGNAVWPAPAPTPAPAPPTAAPEPALRPMPPSAVPAPAVPTPAVPPATAPEERGWKPRGTR